MSIYLDHAATTPVSDEVMNAMMPYFSKYFGNPSSLHRSGQYAKEAIDDARFSISQYIGCSLDEIIFTSGATESNNLFIKGVIENALSQSPDQKPHIISSPIEHSATREVLMDYEKKQKIDLTWARVDHSGIVEVEEIKSLITPNTLLISLQAVNNEIGTIQPISRIGRICQKQNILFHVDAVQAIGYIPVSCEAWKCDGLSISGHKIYGPKGIGLLVVKSGTELCPQILGGGQERTYRSGTENVPGIVGLATAIANAYDSYETTTSHLFDLQKKAKAYIEKNAPTAQWNGAEIGENRSVANINVCFNSNISGESLVQRLSLEGIEVSLGSACGSGLIHPSHVLLAIGKSTEVAKTSLRISMGKTTTESQLMHALETIIRIVEKMTV